MLFNLAYPFLVIMVNIMLQVNKQNIQVVKLDFRERKRQKGSGRSNLQQLRLPDIRWFQKPRMAKKMGKRLGREEGIR